MITLWFPAFCFLALPRYEDGDEKDVQMVRGSSLPINKKRFPEIADTKPPGRFYVTLEALLLSEIFF